MTITTDNSANRTSFAPPPRTVRAPSWAPRMFATARTSPSCHHTCPPHANTSSAPRLVEAFTTFAMAADLRKSCDSSAVNAMMRNMPVPGPKMPS